MSEALKPCPFCAEVPTYYQGGYERYVRCEICLTQGPIAYTDQEAVEFWNRRPSPWRDFRKERPADQVRCWIIYEDCLGQSEESEMAWFYVQHDYWRDSTGERVYIKDIKWLFWMPYQAPAPPTAAEIEAAMKGEK